MAMTYRFIYEKGGGNTSTVVYTDLDNDDEINSDDKDGWSEYQGLPVTQDDTYSWNSKS